MTTTMIKPTKGRLLVSVPFLNDQFFGRSVVLITEHNEEGSVGLIINKPLSTAVGEAIKDFSDFNTNLHMGGPVEPNSLFYLHTKPDLIEGSVKVLENLYWGGNFESVKAMIKNKQIAPEEIKFFVGYSGWGPNQLDEELKRKSWIVTKAKVDKIMEPNLDSYWKDNLNDSNKKEYSVWANYPVNPSLN